jgi:hypothetical protein
MNFSKVDRAVAACKKHLKNTKTENTEIEAGLAAYLVVLVSAEFELRVSELIQARAGRSNDEHIKNFVKHAATKIVRGPKIGEISGILKCFHKKCFDDFHATADDVSKTAYDSIMTNRHNFVHDGIYNLTVGDVERFFNSGRGVFSAIIAALGLRTKEISHLF